MLVLNLYIASVLVSLGTIVIVDHAASRKAKQLGYKEPKDDRSFLDKSIDLIPMITFSLIPVFNLISAFSVVTSYKVIENNNLSNYIDVLENDIKKLNKDSSEKEDEEKKETLQKKAYKDMTRNEKIIYLLEEKEKLMNQNNDSNLEKEEYDPKLQKSIGRLK